MNRHALVALLCCACSAAPVTPTPDDTADALRHQLAKDPDDPRRVTVMEQLAQVELARARQSNTIAAYRRFLSEFPAGDEAVTARALLEELRFEDARRMNTSAGWEAFLADHPRGKHESDARSALGALEIAAALKSEDLSLVRQTLARFPDHADRTALVAHEDDLAWAAAAAAGGEAVDAYLSSHPNGAHRLGAQQHQEDNELKDILDSEDLARAEALTARADATEQHRALVAKLRLAFALRSLDFPALKAISATKTAETTVAAVVARARESSEAFDAAPMKAEEKNFVVQAAPGAGLPPHAELVRAVQFGDPALRVAALRELAEWASVDDFKLVLTALHAEYVSIRLEAVEVLRTWARSFKPAVWQALRRNRETELLTKELTAPVWREIAALRDADGRVAEAITAWRAVLAQDSGDLAARARLFALVQTSSDRIAQGATARDLLKESIEFAENRWTPPRKGAETPAGKGRVVGVSGSLTILRQVCSAMTLGAQASKALEKLASTAPVQEQQLLTLARSDGEAALDRIRARRAQLEKDIRGEDPSYPACEADLATEPIAASRRSRSAAIRQLGRSGDVRLLPFLEGLQLTPGEEVRTAAAEAVVALKGTAAK